MKPVVGIMNWPVPVTPGAAVATGYGMYAAQFMVCHPGTRVISVSRSLAYGLGVAVGVDVGSGVGDAVIVGEAVGEGAGDGVAVRVGIAVAGVWAVVERFMLGNMNSDVGAGNGAVRLWFAIWPTDALPAVADAVVIAFGVGVTSADRCRSGGAASAWAR
jgi:hypothetical protein